MAVALRPIRRTQEERSAATRARLLDATIECLDQLGYSGTTTTEIAERAGVSRGAQLHHFPTKAELVTTAVEHLFRRRDAEFRAAFRNLPEGTDRDRAAIDLLWSMVSGPTFHAWLELVVAARTDAHLRDTVAAITRRFVENVGRTFHELFPAPERPNAFFEIAPTFAFAVMEGLALGQIVLDDEERRTQVLDLLKALTGLAFPPPKST